ncbi:DUF934 domain-containing protein [Teredinibacter sp. KSP-S5-2]|uniref:DUF934 domain-containing protein n=1 Tax=Teredinibacter sp. KSP-S5-2 TaxID=3034506 RepID=UPI002934CF16|nr:DUF934 domain-containing protein [Teredinibacter sp. KSP-S5-2]WNO11381.1 DUF934 domain-containing protein [Teredinibacter sp. KSP-S5-2]
MQKLIKDKEIIDDSWSIVREEGTGNGNQILSLDAFLKAAKEGNLDTERTAVWLASDASIEAIADYVPSLKLIAVDFPAFADGRGFSIGRMLREQYDFTGELRAVGHFMEDQVFYLSRCGFNAFKMEDDCNLESMLNRLNDFSNSYQAAVDEPQPLFRRRA